MVIDVDSMTPEEYAAYRDECDARSSAEYRMRRELCGIEIAEVAEALGVRLDTAKRFENPRKGMPPSLRAWAYVDSAYLELVDAVEGIVRRVEDADENGGAGTVRLPYRRGNQQSSGLSVGRANAVARGAAIALGVLGYDTAAEWAGDGAAGIPRNAPL